jgi:integrase
MAGKKEAQMMLGHADPTTTMRNYQHSSLGSKKSVPKKITTFMP